MPLRRPRRIAVTASSSRVSASRRVYGIEPSRERGVDASDRGLHQQRLGLDGHPLIRGHADGPGKQVDRDRPLPLWAERMQRSDLRDLVGHCSAGQPDRADRFVDGGPHSVPMLGERQLGNVGWFRPPQAPVSGVSRMNRTSGSRLRSILVSRSTTWAPLTSTM